MRTKCGFSGLESKKDEKKGGKYNMAKSNDDKTNVMRLLDKKKIDYKVHSYADTDAIAGTEVAAVLGEDAGCVFKTLVTVGKSNNHYVFMIPVACELDLKKAAKCVGEKKIEMIKSKDLLGLTGYIHGGCSPIGMKKLFKTTIDETAQNYEHIFFSAGKIGFQIECSLSDLQKVVPVGLYDLT